MAGPTPSRRKQPWRHELRVQRPDGSQIWIGYRGEAEHDSQGRPVRSFGIVMDITDRKQAEQILRDSGREKDNFIATLSHELRNPLAPIRNAVECAAPDGSPTDPSGLVPRRDRSPDPAA